MQALLTSRGRTWLGYAFWCALAMSGFVLTFGFEGEIANYRYGAGGWPRALFVTMVVAATIQLLVTLRQTARGDAAEADQGDDKNSGDGPVSLGGLPLRTITVPVIYIAFLVPVGFFVATPPFLAGVMIAMGERRPMHIALVTLLIYTLVILVFIKLLYVPLPIGTWPGFYDIGNWFLVAIR